MDHKSILDDLKIARDSTSTGDDARAMRWALPVGLGLVALVAVMWFLMPGEAQPVVEAQTTQVQATSTLSNAPNDPSGKVLLEASGYVVARREATVSSKITGRVTEVLIEEGQQVTAGQVIARLDASNVAAALDQAEAQIGTAQANANFADVAVANTQRKLARVEVLSEAGWISKQGLDDARAAFASARSNSELARRQIVSAQASRQVTRRSMDDTVVRAPFSGVVTVKAAQVGEIVSPISAGGGFTRTGICTIVDMHSLEVEVDVAENYINRVRAGMPARVTLNAYPDLAILAEVAAVIPTGDRSKATVKVRIRFQAEDPRIIPEMGAKVAFLNDAAAK